MTATVAERVPALVAELELNPKDRAEVVFEIAAEFARAGDPRSALYWLRSLAAVGGLDAALARVEIASIHFAAGRAELATAELAAIRATCPGDPLPYAMAAELLAEHGEQSAALVWFTMAAARFDADQLAAAAGADGWVSAAYGVLWQRRRLRERLGYPPDDLDAELTAPPSAVLPTMDEALADGVPGLARRMRVLVWPQREFALARQRWPRLLDEAVDHAEYRLRLEAQLRDTAAAGPVTIDLIPARVDALEDHAARCGGSVHDAQVRRSYLDEHARLGHAQAWPPGRNAACWCGSNAKYKKCCGRPAS